MLTAYLERWIPGAVRDICGRLAEAGFAAWVVGGCVRDSLLASQRAEAEATAPADWDIATSAKPEQVIRLFRRVIPTGIDHGTVTVMVGGHGYEVTTFRAEAAYGDGRRPESVTFIDDIQAGLARRDFTVNAVAYDPLSQTLVDPFGGVEDLKQGILRAVGVAEDRFLEDGLRVLRAARFVASLEFDLEEKTRAAVRPSLGSYRKVSPERIREEWLKTMKAKRPSRAFDVMLHEGMLAVTAPELVESFGCEQNRHHAFDVWGHTMACMDACPRSSVLRMAGLLHDVGKPRSRAFSDKTQDYTFYNHESIGADMARPMLERLRFSNADRDRIVNLVRHHLLCYDETWTDAAVRRWLRRVSPELAEDLYELGQADAQAKGRDPTEDVANIHRLRDRVTRLLAAGAAVTTKDLAINGQDLMSELGLRPSKQLGDLLKQLLEEVTEDPALNQKEALLARCRDLINRVPDPQ